MIKKADSQPHFETIQGTDNGAKMAPTLVPELNIPVANDLSFFGKYSAVALMAAGKLPASPNPKMALENIKPAIEKGTEVAQKLGKISGDKVTAIQTLLDINKTSIDSLITGISLSVDASRDSLKQIKELELVSRRIDKIVDVFRVVFHTSQLEQHHHGRHVGSGYIRVQMC